MSDDLFSRLFELFNQPGPVNWKLAGELARHLAGELEAVDPFGVEEQRELVRLAEYQVEQNSPFPVAPASDVMVVDARHWVDLVLPGFAYLAEAIAESASGAAPIPGIGATLAGIQVGTLVGTVARQVAASFEFGMPVDPPGPLLIIAAGVDRVVADTGAAPRDVRLWVAAEEVAHRTLFAIPWLTEHLGSLVGAYTAHMVPDPEKLMGMWQGDPERITAALGDPSSMADLFKGAEAEPHRDSLIAFLTITAGYRHHLAQRSIGHLLSNLDSFGTDVEGEGTPLGPSIPVGSWNMAIAGARFCSEVERRYGAQAVDGLWEGLERLPTLAELDDPVGWAARVLLDDGFME
jgi:putative hydrolase